MFFPPEKLKIAVARARVHQLEGLFTELFKNVTHSHEYLDSFIIFL